MTPKKFLTWGGWILLVVGILGFILPEGRLIGDSWVFTSGENWAHLVLGVVALILAYFAPAALHKPVTILVGVLALYFVVHGFAVRAGEFPNYYGVANLENPLDNILHLVVGGWALWASFKK